MRRGPGVSHRKQKRRRRRIDGRREKLVERESHEALDPRERRRIDGLGALDLTRAALAQAPSGKGGEARDARLAAGDARVDDGAPTLVGEDLERVGGNDDDEVGLVDRLFAGEQGARADRAQKRVRGIGKAREPRHLAHDARGAHAREVAPERGMRAVELCLGDDVQVSAHCQQKVVLAKKLHASRQLAAGLSRALRHGASLAAIGLKEREDEVALPQLRAVDDYGRGMACASARHGLLGCLVAKATDLVLVTAPLRANLDAQLEIDLGTEESLDVGARGHADLLDHGAALAHDDALLTLALDEDRGAHAGVAILLPHDVVADDGYGVGNLVTAVEQDLLAHELRHEVLLGGVGVHVVGEPLGALGELLAHEGEEGVDVEALRGARDDDVVEVGKLARGLELGLHLVWLGDVGLREHEDLGRMRLVDVGAHPLVTGAHGLGGVHEHGHDVDVGELSEGGAVELLAQGVLGLVKARRVHDDDLARRRVHDGAQALARGLGHGARDGDALAARGVEQRRLAGVGTAHEGHETTLERGVSHICLLEELVDERRADRENLLVTK